MKELAHLEPNKRLYEAIIENNLEAVKFAIKQGADINGGYTEPNGDNNTPSELTSDDYFSIIMLKKANPNIIEYLLEKGINCIKSNKYAPFKPVRTILQRKDRQEIFTLLGNYYKKKSNLNELAELLYFLSYPPNKWCEIIGIYNSILGQEIDFGNIYNHNFGISSEIINHFLKDNATEFIPWLLYHGLSIDQIYHSSLTLLSYTEYWDENNFRNFTLPLIKTLVTNGADLNELNENYINLYEIVLSVFKHIPKEENAVLNSIFNFLESIEKQNESLKYIHYKYSKTGRYNEALKHLNRLEEKYKDSSTMFGLIYAEKAYVYDQNLLHQKAYKLYKKALYRLQNGNIPQYLINKVQHHIEKEKLLQTIPAYKIDEKAENFAWEVIASRLYAEDQSIYPFIIETVKGFSNYQLLQDDLDILALNALSNKRVNWVVINSPNIAKYFPNANGHVDHNGVDYNIFGYYRFNSEVLTLNSEELTNIINSSSNSNSLLIETYDFRLRFACMLAHENAHHVMQLIYNNDSNPYPNGSNELKQKFEQAKYKFLSNICQKLRLTDSINQNMSTYQIGKMLLDKKSEIEERFSISEQHIINIFLDVYYYLPEKEDKELIVRINQVVAANFKFEDMEMVKPFFDYHEKYIKPVKKLYIANHPNRGMLKALENNYIPLKDEPNYEYNLLSKLHDIDKKINKLEGSKNLSSIDKIKLEKYKSIIENSKKDIKLLFGQSSQSFKADEDNFIKTLYPLTKNPNRLTEHLNNLSQENAPYYLKISKITRHELNSFQENLDNLASKIKKLELNLSLQDKPRLCGAKFLNRNSAKSLD